MRLPWGMAGRLRPRSRAKQGAVPMCSSLVGPGWSAFVRSLIYPYNPRQSAAIRCDAHLGHCDRSCAGSGAAAAVSSHSGHDGRAELSAGVSSRLAEAGRHEKAQPRDRRRRNEQVAVEYPAEGAAGFDARPHDGRRLTASSVGRMTARDIRAVPWTLLAWGGGGSAVSHSARSRATVACRSQTR